jgi:hypothetical protein
MQKEFNKLSINYKRRFIIKNFLRDNYFYNYHNKIKLLYQEYIYTKAEQKNKFEIKQSYFCDKITNILTNYKDNLIDYYCDPTNLYFYNKTIFYKNKLIKMMNYNILNYKDENGFYIYQLILDTWKNTSNIIKNPETSIESIVSLHLFNLKSET